jgi:hypothetical protein
MISKSVAADKIFATTCAATGGGIPGCREPRGNRR